uniref:TNFR-Cys domain-containing protein n=1 Tax=Tetraodon nigroviridis TaxID=99883 RepID=H3CRH2_TETNG
MAPGSCSANQYTSETGECCDRCEAGSYMKAECDGTKATECAECGRDYFLATQNHMRKCHACTVCSSDSNQKVLEMCTAWKDTVCTCVSGFYCSNDKCEHCQPVSDCPPGEGVKTLAFNTTDTVCGACEEGTYSNVTDFQSPCRAHTRCEDFGGVVSRPGTSTSDAVCGSLKSECPWQVPAGLWLGLVLFAFILLAVCWWLRRKSKRSYSDKNGSHAGAAAVTVTFVFQPAALSFLLRCLMFTNLVRTLRERALARVQAVARSPSIPTLFSPADHDKVPGSTPLNISLTESSNGNGSTGYCTGNFHRSISEPQEDEWCET